MSRSVGWLFRAGSAVSGSIHITVGRLQTIYRVEEMPADLGRGFRLTKEDGSAYDVLLAHPGQGFDSCECMGHCRWGTPCKHIAGMKALLGREGGAA
jgi:hypothetical protein